jgi:hypothetical protein
MARKVADVNDALKAEVRMVARLSERLSDLVPWDEAAWHLGVVLGMWPDGTYAEFTDKRGGNWHNGITGNALYDALTALQKGGVLVRLMGEKDWEFAWGKC